MTRWWQDPMVEGHLAVIYVDIVFLLLGVHGWEYLQSLDVEYAVIRRRLPLRWPLVPYLMGRLFLLIALLLLAIETSPLSGSFACQPGITAISVSVDIAIGTASANLMVRTWVIWKNSRWVHLLLVLLAFGQWTILVIDAVYIKASRSNAACVVYVSHPAASAGVFMYTMCNDFLVLVLSVVKLSRQPSKSPLKERLYAQGLSYFVVAGVANIPPTVFAFLGSSGFIGITANIAITASTIVSCRAVRSLLGFHSLPSSHTCGETAEDDTELTTQFPNQNQTMITSMGVC